MLLRRIKTIKPSGETTRITVQFNTNASGISSLSIMRVVIDVYPDDGNGGNI
jgi:hypothetical protein